MDDERLPDFPSGNRLMEVALEEIKPQSDLTSHTCWSSWKILK